jgi:Holliday junction resolvase
LAQTPEAKVKKLVVAQLKALGTYYFYPVTGGFGNSGVPDIVGCHKGLFFGIECKAGKNKPTDLQEKNLAQIAAAGGLAMVVNETNVETVTRVLEEAAWALENNVQVTGNRATGAADQ